MAENKNEFRRRDRWLLFATFVGPLAVLSNLSLNYSLAASACAEGSTTMLHVVTLVFAAIALSGALVGWRRYNEFEESEAVLWKERTRWMSMIAMVLSLGSILVLVAMEIPNVILRSCD
jgi:hypothetical protein